MKKLLLKSSIVIAIIFIIMLITSYAYYLFSGGSTVFDTTTYNSYIDIIYEVDEYINITNAIPISDDDIESEASYNDFTVSIKDDNNNYLIAEVLLSISLTNITIDDELKNTDFKYQLLHNDEIVASGTGLDFTSTSIELSSKEVIYYDIISYFTFRVWISDNGEDQNEMQNKTFSASIEVNAIKIRNATESDYKDRNTLYNTILLAENNSDTVDDAITYIESKGTPDFTTTATTDEGIYQTEEDGTDVYYYRGAVEDNNVLFAGYCWKIIRTTKTGGIKMIYNGDPYPSENTPIAEDEYTNVTSDNDLFTYDTSSSSWVAGSSSSYEFYGIIDFGITESGNYALNLNYDIPESYMFGFSVAVNDEIVFDLWINESDNGEYNEEANEEASKNLTIYLGYLDGNNELYVFVNGYNYENDILGNFSNFSIGLVDEDSDLTCENYGEMSQITTTEFNSSETSPAYVGYMYGTVYTYSSKTMSSDTTEYVYGNSVSYSNGTYTLTDTTSSSSWSSIYNGGLNSYHYTCFSTSDSCTSVYYIYYTTSTYAYYITLTGGKTVSDALSEMLDTNTTDSTIKTNIDSWYSSDMTGYTSYIEDTVYCNDRSIYDIAGWNPDGGSTRSYCLYFSAYGRAYKTYSPTLSCDAEDSFTVSTSNGNGKLDYPVGLISADEVMMAGGNGDYSNSSYYLFSGYWYWAGSPYGFYYDYLYGFGIGTNGYLVNYYVSEVDGTRPVLSLKEGTTISQGDGTSTNPYVIS